MISPRRSHQSHKLEVLGTSLQSLMCGIFRTLLSKRLSIRATPKLRFYYDTLQSEGMNLEQKIKEARSKDQINTYNEKE